MFITYKVVFVMSPVTHSVAEILLLSVAITHVTRAIHIHEVICMNLREDWRGGVSSSMRLGGRRRSQIGLVSQRERELILREIGLVRKIGREGGNDIAREKKYVLRELLMISLLMFI